MKEIIVDILPSGKIEMETKGFSGNECIKSSQFLKDLLGKETNKKHKSEYYQVTNTNKYNAFVGN